MGSVTKGGECWLETTVTRNSKGIEVWVRTLPKVEDFIKMLSEGDGGVDTLDAFGKQWFSINPNPIQVSRIVKEVESNHYSMNTIGGTISSKHGGTNLSFLRFVGVGSNEGVKFGMAGPHSRDYIKTMVANILTGSRQLFRDYIAPVHINLRVTSTEL